MLNLKWIEASIPFQVQVTDADWFSSIKSEYYREKDVICAEKDIRSHATDYVSTLQWLLSYYYTGECAWNWYYPCHYAPFVSDFPEMGDLKFDFGQSGPALPFEHLLHIQPIKGAYLLPQPIRALMEKEMARYFPTEVAFDFNEKMCEWERLALLPFINTDEFGAVIHAAHDQLTEAEKKRNMAKPMIQYEGLEYEDDVLADRIELPMELFSRHAIECIPIRRTCTFDPTVVNFSHLKYLLYSVMERFRVIARQKMNHYWISERSGEIVESTSAGSFVDRFEFLWRGNAKIGKNCRGIIEQKRQHWVATCTPCSGRITQLIDEENHVVRRSENWTRHNIARIAGRVQKRSLSS